MKKIINFFNREQNLLIHIIATILVTIFGIVFKISEKEWLIVYLLCAFVISTELVNSSIELAVDIITDVRRNCKYYLTKKRIFFAWGKCCEKARRKI